MTAARILIGGIGNELFGDDGFGVAVARALGARRLPAEVRAVEFGIRGFDLASALLEGYDTVILVDAAPRGGPPGTLYVIEPEQAGAEAARGTLDPHGFTPPVVLSWVKALSGAAPRVFLVGCEPDAPSDEVPGVALSAPVAAAVGPAVELVESLLARLGATPARAG